MDSLVCKASSQIGSSMLLLFSTVQLFCFVLVENKISDSNPNQDISQPYNFICVSLINKPEVRGKCIDTKKWNNPEKDKQRERRVDQMESIMC